MYKNTKIFLRNKCISRDYFTHDFKITTKQMHEVAKESTKLTTPHRFGMFINDQHYLDSVDLLINSTTETQRRNILIEQEVLPSLTHFDNMLDIGVGNGELTEFVGQHFTNITIVDNSLDTLNKIHDNHTSGTKIDKILGSVLDVEIPNKQYDLILLSHVIYYINPELRNVLISKLYNLLNTDGIILIIFIEGGNRYEMTRHFGGTHFNFDNFTQYTLDSYKNVNIIEFEETIQTNAIEPMLHIV